MEEAAAAAEIRFHSSTSAAVRVRWWGMAWELRVAARLAAWAAFEADCPMVRGWMDDG